MNKDDTKRSGSIDAGLKDFIVDGLTSRLIDDR